MRKFLVVLLVLLAVLVVAADMGGRSLAQSMIAQQISQRMEMSEEPEVSIEGWAFLPQALGGTYEELNIRATSATLGEVTAEQIEITASDVEAPLADLLSTPNVVAGTLEGTAVLPYSFVNPYLPEGVTVSTENGSPRISGTVALADFGISVPVEAAPEITVEEGTILVTPTDVQVGDAPVDVSGMVADMITFSFPMPELPYGLALTGAESIPGGLRITGTATDVPLMGSEAA
ncbi:DUF2993 domain-containing protein [Nocardiopsis algeriensis]|uniref:LmeA family phospholipid-binding protein n=1 Tax=Nocardiopsis algeriensis TaxID=1478215 RepID=UPI003B43CE08